MSKFNKQQELSLLAEILSGAGDFEQFYNHYHNLIMSCVIKVYNKYGYKPNEEDLSDVVGQVFYNLIKDDFKKLRLYDSEKGYKLSSWIGLIATNTTYDILRKKGPTTFSLDDEESYLPKPESIFGLPHKELEEKEKIEIINLAINQLSPKEQRFMELIYEHYLSPEEISMHLGISINTVYSKKNKIKNKLIKIISEILDKNPN